MTARVRSVTDQYPANCPAVSAAAHVVWPPTTASVTVGWPPATAPHLLQSPGPESGEWTPAVSSGQSGNNQSASPVLASLQSPTAAGTT